MANVDVAAHLALLETETRQLHALLADPHPGLATWMQAFCAAAERLLPDLAVVAGCEAEVRAALARHTPPKS